MLAIQLGIANYRFLYTQGEVAFQTPGVFLSHLVEMTEKDTTLASYPIKLYTCLKIQAPRAEKQLPKKDIT